MAHPSWRSRARSVLRAAHRASSTWRVAWSLCVYERPAVDAGRGQEGQAEAGAGPGREQSGRSEITRRQRAQRRVVISGGTAVGAYEAPVDPILQAPDPRALAGKRTAGSDRVPIARGNER